VPATPEACWALRDQHSFEGFVALLALAWEARCRTDLQVMCVAAHSVRAVFPKVVSKVPELWVSWPRLLATLGATIFAPPASEVSIPWIPVETADVEGEVSRLDKALREKIGLNEPIAS